MPESHLQFVVPEDLGNGQYADIVSVWHNPFGFTLDFAVLDQPQQIEGSDDVVVPAHVTARMKIPATVVFQIARAIADNVTKYEAQYGAITPRPADGSVIPQPGTTGEETGDDDEDRGR